MVSDVVAVKLMFLQAKYCLHKVCQNSATIVLWFRFCFCLSKHGDDGLLVPNLGWINSPVGKILPILLLAECWLGCVSRKGRKMLCL